ncbi:MAG: hypothetical protein H0X37_04370 [Herpetosiphonaceae bacterium]|nr:hypothetical protein [Herpetosiphonaceae bacterium]
MSRARIKHVSVPKGWSEEWGSSVAQAAAVALLTVALIGALVLLRSSFTGQVDHAFNCVIGAISGGSGSCNGGGASTTGGNGASGGSSTNGDQAKQDHHCDGWCQVGGFFKGFGEGAVDTVKGLWTLGSDGVKLAMGDQATRDKYGALIDAFKRDPGGTLLAMGKSFIAPAVDAWKSGNYGEAAGRVSFDIASFVVADHGLDKLGKLAKVDEVLVDGTRVASKTGDGLDDVGKVGRYIPCVGFGIPTGRVAGLAIPLANCPLGKIAGTRGLEHSFSEHAAQWFGREVPGSTYLPQWQALIERAAQSSEVFDWSTGAAKTTAHLARIDGKWFVVQFFKDGPRAGELATAFVPNQGQLAAMLRLLGHIK